MGVITLVRLWWAARRAARQALSDRLSAVDADIRDPHFRLDRP